MITVEVFKWYCADAEIEQCGYFMVSDDEKPMEKASKIAITNENLSIEYIMSKAQLEDLLVKGKCELFCIDMDGDEM